MLVRIVFIVLLQLLFVSARLIAIPGGRGYRLSHDVRLHADARFNYFLICLMRLDIFTFFQPNPKMHHYKSSP